MGKKRKSYSPSFKAKVALAAIRQEKTLSQLSAQFKVHPVAIARWKAHLLDQAAEVFIDGRTQKPSDDPTVEEFGPFHESSRVPNNPVAPLHDRDKFFLHVNNDQNRVCRR